MLIHDWNLRNLMLESPTEPQCPGTTSDETATADKRNMPDCTVNNPPVNNSHVNSICTPTPRINSINNHIHTYPTPQTNPSQLYDTLYPALLHQHSTLASLQHILHPILHLTIIPTHELQLLHRLLGGHPSAQLHLPPLPDGGRPRRAPPISYLDTTEPPHISPPPALSFPLGTRDGVGVAASTLSTPDNDAGLGLFGISPKRSSYARLNKFKHLFARKGDFICS